MGVLAHNATGTRYEYEKHYPIGRPDDSTSPEIPEPIAGEYREAIRCRWVNAYRASVLLCRRALEVSCQLEKAQGKLLFDKIEDLAGRQMITGTLKRMASRIRLLGNTGAHGDYMEVLDNITEADADDALQFMEHYLNYVYVFPARLNQST